MGIWGLTPLENDAAQDWLELLFEQSGLEAMIEATVQLDIHKSPHEIRAAASVLHVLVKADLWPREQRAASVSRALFRLEQMLAERVVTNANLVAQIHQEIAALRKCVSPPSPQSSWPQLPGQEP